MTHRKTEKERHFADRRGGRGRGGARAIPNHATGSKLVLYNLSILSVRHPPTSHPSLMIKTPILPVFYKYNLE
jgi:hypothetical protein